MGWISWQFGHRTDDCRWGTLRDTKKFQLGQDTSIYLLEKIVYHEHAGWFVTIRLRALRSLWNLQKGKMVSMILRDWKNKWENGGVSERFRWTICSLKDVTANQKTDCQKINRQCETERKYTCIIILCFFSASKVKGTDLFWGDYVDKRIGGYEDEKIHIKSDGGSYVRAAMCDTCHGSRK